MKTAIHNSIKDKITELKKDLKEVELNCEKCNNPYTKEEMECDHCFNCGEQILETF